MPNQPKTPTRAIRIPDDTWAELQRIATGQRLPVSELVRDVLRNYVERDGDVREEATGTGADEG